MKKATAYEVINKNMLLEVIAGKDLPPEAWKLIEAAAMLVLGAIIRFFEKKRDKKRALKAIKKSVDKTKDGFLVIPEKELEEAGKANATI